MPVRAVLLTTTAAITLWATGCAGASRLSLAQPTGGSAALYRQFQAYDGHTGRPISFSHLLRRCRGADVILFGEQHSNSVCNQLEAQLLYGLAGQSRTLALAMEFFEADTQAALDAYLTGRIEEPPFRAQTRQRRAYVLSHRPLIELCRTARIPVLAANAPRRLVRAYRKSGLTYDAYRAGLPPTDQRWLPTQNEYLRGPYHDRFAEMMAEHGPTVPSPPMPTTAAASQPATSTAPASMPAPEQPAAPSTQPQPAPPMPPVSQPVATMPTETSLDSFYQAQLLWDQAMAESLANFRSRFPTHRLMLITGVFHVAHDGGTAAKFRRHRPHDRVLTIVYRTTTDGRLLFDEADQHAGDVVIYGITPPPEEAGPTVTTAPTTMPLTTTPTSGPATEPATTQTATTSAANASRPAAP